MVGQCCLVDMESTSSDKDDAVDSEELNYTSLCCCHVERLIYDECLESIDC